MLPYNARMSEQRSLLLAAAKHVRISAATDSDSALVSVASSRGAPVGVGGSSSKKPESLAIGWSGWRPGVAAMAGVSATSAVLNSDPSRRESIPWPPCTHQRNALPPLSADAALCVSLLYTHAYFFATEPKKLPPSTPSRSSIAFAQAALFRYISSFFSSSKFENCWLWKNNSKAFFLLLLATGCDAVSEQIIASLAER